MLLKPGVDISRLRRMTRRGLSVSYAVYAADKQEIVITSTFEGQHSPGSLHYANQAFDVRLPTGNRDTMMENLKKALGSAFDVVLERTHIHIEYDPK